MVVVDSSVWIDFFNGSPNPARDALRELLADGDVRIVVPDLVLYEVLRGFRHERDYRQALELLATLSIEQTGGVELALEAAHQFRSLRAAGITPRNSIDVLVATYCIERDYLLLHRDRDFDAFEELRGLRSWKH